MTALKPSTAVDGNVDNYKRVIQLKLSVIMNPTPMLPNPT